MKKMKRKMLVWSMVLVTILFYVFTATSNIYAADEKVTVTYDELDGNYTLNISTSKINRIRRYEYFLNNERNVYYTSSKSFSLYYEDLTPGDYTFYVVVYFKNGSDSVTSNTLTFTVPYSTPTPSVIPTTSVIPTASITPSTVPTVSPDPTTSVIPTNSVDPTETTVVVTSAVPTVTATKPETSTIVPSTTNGIEAPEEEIIANNDANSPELKSGMVPVKFDTYKNEWVICSKSDKNWFSYSKESRRWANIMLLDSLSTEHYTNNDIKALLPQYGGNLCELLQGEKVETMGSMFVWIPRYAYCISSNYHTKQENIFNIEFLHGTSSESSVRGRRFVKTPGNRNWLIHPAFTKNDDNGGWTTELRGIWVAKFEASGTKENVQFVAGVRHLVNIDIDEMFIASSLISTVNNSSYGITQGTINSHLLKNSEWGAVTYLTYSIYGRDLKEITPNSNSLFTGGGQYNSYKANTNQTTTNNIYGIYDLSGGACEYVSAHCAPLYYEATYGNSIAKADSSMKNTYNVGQYGGEETYENCSMNYGDAMYETSCHYDSDQSWFNDTSRTFVLYSSLLRGGTYADGRIAGLFNFEGGTGDGFSLYTFRVSIVTF